MIAMVVGGAELFRKVRCSRHMRDECGAALKIDFRDQGPPSNYDLAAINGEINKLDLLLDESLTNLESRSVEAKALRAALELDDLVSQRDKVV